MTLRAIAGGGAGAAATDAVSWGTILYQNADSSTFSGFPNATVTQEGTNTATAPTGASDALSYYHLNRTTTAAINSSASQRCDDVFLRVYRTTTSGAGGFSYRSMIALSTSRATQRLFVGVKSGTTAPGASTDPSAMTDIVGIGKDEADANLQVMHNDASGAATKVDLGVTVASLQDKLLDVLIATNSDGSVTVTVENLTDGTSYTATATTNLPTVDTRLIPVIWVNTGASVGTSVGVRCYRWQMSLPQL